MTPYQVRQAEKYYKLVDAAIAENNRIIEAQKEGRELDKQVLPEGTFTINTLAAQLGKRNYSSYFKKR